MKYTIDEKYPPKHTLTSAEMNFLQKLASYKLLLDKSLFFQINDLQQHTKLILSGDLCPREKFPDTAEKEKELAELDKLIEEYADKLEGGEMGQEERTTTRKLLALWKKQRKELKKVLEKPKTEKKSNSNSNLGAYFNKGEHSKVILFVDAIEKKAKDPYQTMLLMGQVMLHEYFHSFYFHVGVGSKIPIKCMEEPMAEYGSLAFLFSVARSRSSIAKQADDAWRNAYLSIKKKQRLVGTSAAYGYGFSLFNTFGEYYRDLIASYANVSCLLDAHSQKALEYKYMLYPTYPTSSYIENVVLYDWFDELIESIKP